MVFFHFLLVGLIKDFLILHPNVHLLPYFGENLLNVTYLLQCITETPFSEWAVNIAHPALCVMNNAR